MKKLTQLFMATIAAFTLNAQDCASCAPAETAKQTSCATEACSSCECDKLSYAPAGIMGDHQHGKGSLMFSYKTMYMHMDGLRNGDSGVSADDVLGMPAMGKYMVVPEEMDMTMHMFGTMYGISDKQTLMLMVPYIYKSMRLRMANGNRFTTDSDGLGDISLTLLHELKKDEKWDVQLGLGISAPTGSIEVRDRTPMNSNLRLPYPMQLGTGTWNVLPQITATRFNDEWTFGAQLKAKIHLDDNDRGYAPGDEFTSSVWASRELTERFTASLRLQGQIRQDYRGFDSETNMMRNMTPTADAEIRGGSRIDVLPGLSYAFEAQELSNRLAVEVGFPVYEKVEGVNLETDLTVNASWQLLF